MKPILIIAEVMDGCIRPVTWELIAAARVIRDLIQTNRAGGKRKAAQIAVIVPAQDPVPLAREISSLTKVDVLALKVPTLVAYTSEAYKECLAPLIQELAPSHILVAHTSQGRDFAPGLAIRLNAASISGVNQIRSDGDGLLYSRPGMNNTRNMVLRPEPGFPLVLTLTPGIFLARPCQVKDPGAVMVREISFGPKQPVRMVHQKIARRENEHQALKKAHTIVAAGRGIGERSNLESVARFAKYFSASALGASRPLVDMGWIGYDHQVGITGASVAPRLYIACGISGSSQHLAGMKGSDWVVSINKHPEAPICSHADVCIVADVIDFIRVFLEQEDALQGKI
ncbi:MAG: electron transfer flavoprotein subunit alpha/FixB family protein [Proteobacteria bacterium]|nr:electron transfer flavoprotein subunit alpha/FixB family protein [Desulfobacula sp.]MBU3954535.1 electron transfer flavoprotein subunit alpha/FixB family protein [Pseudomonadota bacterium]MBU4131160.1 electron transfer flavoprotein subunit alpha/FixB family protein [Pseudomonadota bacterium]